MLKQSKKLGSMILVLPCLLGAVTNDAVVERHVITQQDSTDASALQQDATDEETSISDESQSSLQADAGGISAEQSDYLEDTTLLSTQAESVQHPLPPLPAKIKISEVFPDRFLAGVVGTSLSVSVNSLIDEAELRTIRLLRSPGSPGRKIQSLEGMQYLTELQTLELNSHEIVDLTPLQGLTKLLALALRSNKIVDIQPLQDLILLQIIEFGHNEIQDISALRNLLQLRRLEVFSNKISDISAVTELKRLITLRIEANNTISDIAPVAGLVELKQLFFSHNLIRDITPLKNLKKLELLDCFNNKITDISILQELENLKQLYIGRVVASNNIITDFSVLETLPQLEFLHLQGQDITKIPLAVLRRVKDLAVPFAELPDLSVFAGLSNLRTLNLYGNNFSDITPLATASWPHLTEIRLDSNQLTDLRPLKGAYMPKLQKIGLQDQKPTLSVVRRSQTIVENKVQDIMGNLIAPNRIEPVNKGRYESPNIIWSSLFVGSAMSYTWNKTIMVGGVTTIFSGTHSFERVNDLPAQFIVEGNVHATRQIYGGRVNQPSVAPVKIGCQFVGWFTAETGGRKWDFVNDRVGAEEIVLYAQFTPLQYPIVYDEGDSSTTPFNIIFGEALVEPPQPTKIGHTFVGWYAGVSDSRKWDFTVDKMPARALDLYAHYELNSYPIVFNNDGWEQPIIKRVKYGSLIQEPEEPLKIGYIFAGWYTSLTGGDLWDFAVETMPAREVMLYSRWVRLPIDPSWVMRGDDLAMPSTKFFSLQASNMLEEVLLEWANVQVLNEEGLLLYDNTNTTFSIGNIAELMQITKAGLYIVEIVYTHRLTYMQIEQLVVKLPLQIEFVDTNNPTDLEEKNLDNDRLNNQGGKNNGNGLTQTGAQTFEKVVYSIFVIGSSVVLFFIVYVRRKSRIIR